MLNISVLDDLSTFEYVELINDILENWILYVECGMNCVTACCGCEFEYCIWCWEISVVTCLWILGVLSQIVLEHIALGHGYTILGDTRARGSATWVWDSTTGVWDSAIWVWDVTPSKSKLLRNHWYCWGDNIHMFL
jgi:hypothetical protein